MRTVEKQQARELRQQGKSIKEISKLINISSSNISLWVRDIELSKEQLEILKQRNPIYNNQFLGAKARKENARNKRIEYRKEGKEFAKRKEFLHSFGCALYWGEGAKDRSRCKFTNSDPTMLKIFLQFIRTYFPDENIVVHINCYTGNGLSVNDIEKYWSSILEIPIEQFWKSTTDNLSKYSQNKKAKNKLPYGTVQLNILNVKVVQHIFGALEEYAGIKNNFCLD